MVQYGERTVWQQNATVPLFTVSLISHGISWEQDKGGKNALENKAVSRSRGLSSDIASQLLISACRLDQCGQTDARPSPLSNHCYCTANPLKSIYGPSDITYWIWFDWPEWPECNTYNTLGIYRQITFSFTGLLRVEIKDRMSNSGSEAAFENFPRSPARAAHYSFLCALSLITVAWPPPHRPTLLCLNRALQYTHSDNRLLARPGLKALCTTQWGGGSHKDSKGRLHNARAVRGAFHFKSPQDQQSAPACISSICL